MFTFDGSQKALVMVYVNQRALNILLLKWAEIDHVFIVKN